MSKSTWSHPQTIRLHQLLHLLFSFSGADSLPISQVRAVQEKNNMKSQALLNKNTSCGEGHYARQHQPPRMVTNLPTGRHRCSNSEEAVRSRPNQVMCPGSVYWAHASRVSAQGDTSQSSVTALIDCHGRLLILFYTRQDNATV